MSHTKRLRKLGHFKGYQKEYICLCLALDMSIPKIVKNFQTMFPGFGIWLAPKVLRYRLARRISDIKRKNVEEIEACRQRAKEDVQYALKANPMAHLAVRLYKLQEMWDETPFRELVRIQKDPDGKEYPIYKYNMRERLKILKAFEKELEGVSFRYVRVDKKGNETEITAQEYDEIVRQELIESSANFCGTLEFDADGNVYEVTE